jgi:predicted NACHT family NTPase
LSQNCCISEELKDSSSAEQWKVERLLGSGKAIILLDGLDEVSEKDIAFSEVMRYSSQEE